MITSGISCISLMVNVHPRSPRWCLAAPPSRSRFSGEGSGPGSHRRGVDLAGCGGQISCAAVFQLFSLNFDLGLRKDHPPPRLPLADNSELLTRSPARRRCHCLELGMSHKSNFNFQLMENNLLFNFLCCNFLKAGKQEALPSQREAEGIRLPIWVACYNFRK